jgi:hypothetical protein
MNQVVRPFVRAALSVAHRGHHYQLLLRQRLADAPGDAGRLEHHADGVCTYWQMRPMVLEHPNWQDEHRAFAIESVDLWRPELFTLVDARTLRLSV